MINVKEANSVSGFSIKNPTKKIKSIYLKSGFYLCFIDEILLTKDINEQFCEVLCEGEIILLRYKDIFKFII